MHVGRATTNAMHLEIRQIDIQFNFNLLQPILLPFDYTHTHTPTPSQAHWLQYQANCTRSDFEMRTVMRLFGAASVLAFEWSHISPEFMKHCVSPTRYLSFVCVHNLLAVNFCFVGFGLTLLFFFFSFLFLLAIFYSELTQGWARKANTVSLNSSMYRVSSVSSQFNYISLCAQTAV